MIFNIEVLNAENDMVERLTTSDGQVRSIIQMSMVVLGQSTITIKGTFDFDPLTIGADGFVFSDDDSEWHQWSTSYRLSMTSGSPDPAVYWQLDVELGPKWF